MAFGNVQWISLVTEFEEHLKKLDCSMVPNLCVAELGFLFGQFAIANLLLGTGVPTI